MAPDDRPRPPLLLIFAITVTGILGNTLVNAPLPDILREFGQPKEMAGALVWSATLPGIAMAPIIGFLADRFGRRRVLIPCLTVFGVGGLLAVAAPSFPVLMACRLLQGLGSAGLINLAVVLIADSWTGTERARLIGLNAAVLTVSVAVFPAVGGALAQLGGWRWSFVPYGAALVTAVAVGRWLPMYVVPAGSSLIGQLRDARTALRQPVVYGSIAFGCVLFALIFGLFLTVMPLLLDEAYHLEPGTRGLMLAVPAIPSTISALSLSRLRARFGASRLVLLANLLFVAGFLTIGGAGRESLALVIGGAVLYGFGEGMAIPTLQDLVASRAPDSSRGAVIAVWVGVARAGQTIGPAAFSVTMAAVGPSSAFIVGGSIAALLLVAQVAGRRVLTFSPAAPVNA